MLIFFHSTLLLSTATQEWVGIQETKAGVRDADASRAPGTFLYITFIYYTRK